MQRIAYSTVLSRIVAPAILILTPSVGFAEEQLPTVPDGFTIEKVAEYPLVDRPVLSSFDEQGRLYVVDSSGVNLPAAELEIRKPHRIVRLEDTDGDGKFDKSTLFADKITESMGVMCYRDVVYVCSPPSLYRMQDTDGDGVADKRDIVLTGWGWSGNAADIHGPYLGPNGRLYLNHGRKGHKIPHPDGTFTEGKAAGLWRFRPDGSDFERVAGGGFDNPVEAVFTPEGEIFSTMTFYTVPRDGKRDGLLHMIEGGVFPRDDERVQDALSELKKTGSLLPALSEFGVFAPAGLEIIKDTRLGNDFEGNLFSAQFNMHRVQRHILERDGATFRCRDQDFLVSSDTDFHPTDVLQDADGSLLVINTGGWFLKGCPTSQVSKPEILGAIYRIKPKDFHPPADPWGKKLGITSLSAEKLTPLLDDERPAVRERAIDQLSQIGGPTLPDLRRVLHDRNRRVAARRNAVWAASRMETEPANQLIREALADESESVRIAAARSLGMARDRLAVDQLCALVTSDSPAARREAATALGRICDAESTSLDHSAKESALAALFSALPSAGHDRFLEHALIFAMIRIDDSQLTAAYLTDRNPQVRRAALIALDQMDHGNLTREQVARLLDTDDPDLQQEAMAVISRHEGWAGETMSLLRGWLTQSELGDARSAVLRGFLLAQANDPEIQQLVAESLTSALSSRKLRLLMLEVIDRSTIGPLPEVWLVKLEAILLDGDDSEKLQTVRILQAHGIDRFDARLAAIAGDSHQSHELRTEALLAIALRLKKLNSASFTFLLDQVSGDKLPLDRLAAARALADAPLSDAQLLKLAKKLDVVGPIVAPVIVRCFARSSSEQVGAAFVAALKRSDDATSFSPDELRAALQKYPSGVHKQAEELLARSAADQSQQKEKLLALELLIHDGDSQRGREIFFGKKAACSGCHTMGGQGGKVGPDLTAIGSIRTPKDLLEAVAIPSASFARGFRPYLIATTDGRVHTGVIIRQTVDGITLRTAELAEVRIPRSDIETMRESATSIMPAGLEKTLQPQDLSDLLAFLQAQK